MATCGKHFVYLHKRDLEGHTYIFVPSRCKSWSCPKCRPLKAEIVRNYIRTHFVAKELFFLTFTLFHSGNHEESWKHISNSWNKLRTSVTKSVGKFSYIRVIEPHSDGKWPHMHVLVMGGIPVFQLLERAPKNGFGWRCHSRRASTDEASTYLSKYLTKPWPTGDADIMRALTKTRIVSVSRDLPAIFKYASDWECLSYSEPSKEAHERLNMMIEYCHIHKATYCLASPFDEGFTLRTDIYIPPEKLEEILDPYVWDRCDNLHYVSADKGIQMALHL